SDGGQVGQLGTAGSAFNAAAKALQRNSSFPHPGPITCALRGASWAIATFDASWRSSKSWKTPSDPRRLRVGGPASRPFGSCRNPRRYSYPSRPSIRMPFTFHRRLPSPLDDAERAKACDHPGEPRSLNHVDHVADVLAAVRHLLG